MKKINLTITIEMRISDKKADELLVAEALSGLGAMVAEEFSDGIDPGETLWSHVTVHADDRKVLDVSQTVEP